MTLESDTASDGQLSAPAMVQLMNRIGELFIHGIVEKAREQGFSIEDIGTSLVLSAAVAFLKHRPDDSAAERREFLLQRVATICDLVEAAASTKH